MRRTVESALALVMLCCTGAAAQSGSQGFAGVATGTGSHSASTAANGGTFNSSAETTLVNSGTRGNQSRLIGTGGARSVPLQTYSSRESSGNGTLGPLPTPGEVRRLYPETAASGILTGRPTR